MTKPDNLPNMDIIKDKAIAKISSGIPGADKMFTPSFVKPTISNRVIFLTNFEFILNLKIALQYSYPLNVLTTLVFRVLRQGGQVVARRNNVQDSKAVANIKECLYYRKLTNQ